MTASLSEHLRFFQYLAIASKVDQCIAEANSAIEAGHCCVIGLQSTGEASAKRAAAAAGVGEEGKVMFEAFVSAPGEGLKNVIRSIIPEEEVQTWLNAVDELQLPPGHLDRLLSELGGPSKVAELTGRTRRQVQFYDSIQGKAMVRYEKRKADNIQEKNAFQSGEKLIAVSRCQSFLLLPATSCFVHTMFLYSDPLRSRLHWHQSAIRQARCKPAPPRAYHP